MKDLGGDDHEISNAELKDLRAWRRRHDWLVDDGERRPVDGEIKKRMRVAGTKLFEALTDDQQKAWGVISSGFWAASGTGLWATDYERVVVDGGMFRHTDKAWLQDIYIRWGRRCQELEIDTEIARAVIVDGMSCREADEAFRQRHGTASENLHRALDALAEVRSRRLNNQHGGKA
jgi:hypothetical protein